MIEEVKFLIRKSDDNKWSETKGMIEGGGEVINDNIGADEVQVYISPDWDV